MADPVDLQTGGRPLPRLPRCEHTADEGSKGPALDCKARATVRHLDGNGATVAVTCERHADHAPLPGVRGITRREDIPAQWRTE
jgi:hypothetical protein